MTEPLGLDPREPLVRLGRLLDEDSLTPLHERDEIAVTVARGRIGGEKVVAFCTDATRKGGSLGMRECLRIAEATDLANSESCPVIGVWHSGGAKLADGVESMDGIGRIFAATVRASGKVPQISLVLGPAAGGAAYGPALTDLVVMAPAGRIFVTGPDVVKTVTGEQIDMEGLGGTVAHGRRSGVAHVTAASEEAAYAHVRAITELLARPGTFDPSLVTEHRDLRAMLPDSPRRAYDVRPLVKAILDEDTFEELQPRWAANVTVGLGRLAGGSVGVIASNPIRKGGCLDSLSAEKASRFLRMCDAFGIPVLVLIDVPGYLPGVRQEWEGVVRRGAKLLYAFAESTVTTVSLVTRKAYGGAYIAMNSRSLGATAVYAWPDAEVAVMSAEAAVNVLHRKELAAAHHTERDELKTRLVAEHEVRAGGVKRGLDLGVVDEVIDPERTRLTLAETFARTVHGQRGEHGNIPL